MIYQTIITIDMSGSGARPIVSAKQGDIHSRFITCRLTENGDPFEIPAGTQARVAFRKPDFFQVLNDAEISNNTVIVELTEQMLAAAGNALCEIMLMQNDTLLSSTVFDVRIYPTSYNQEVIESSAEYETFVHALEQVQPSIDLCDQAAQNAQTQAQNAQTQAQNAQTQASQAQSSAQRAEAAADQVEQAHLDELTARLGESCSPVSGSLNNVTQSGWYSATHTACTECPPSGESDLFVLQVYQANGCVIQDAFDCSLSPQRYTRTYHQPAESETMEWTSWYRIPVNVTINNKELAGNVSLTANDIGVVQENLLLNSNFTVWQRGTAFASPRNQYTADRWLCNGFGTINVSSSNDPALSGLKVTGSMTLKQVFENNDYKKIAGKTVTLSVSKKGVVSTSTYTVDSPTVVSIPIANTTVNWVKLELGSVATGYISRPYAIELQACKRYYQSLKDLHVQSLQDNYWSVQLPVEMRVAPTLSGTCYWSYFDSPSETGGSFESGDHSQTTSTQIALTPTLTANDKFLWTDSAVYIKADADVYP